MKLPNHKSSFLLGISLIAVGTSLISLMPDTAIGPVFIGIGGLFMIFSIRNKQTAGYESAQSTEEDSSEVTS